MPHGQEPDPHPIMTHRHQSRVFANGTATTLYVTIPAHVVSDSQFPFDTDDEVEVTIDDDRLIISPIPEEHSG